MGALAATDVTLTVNAGDRNIVQGALKNFTVGSIKFGDGSATYPTGGVPLPSIGHFGFHQAIDIMMIDPPLNGFVYKYDKDNHKIKIYTQGVVTGSTGVSADSTGALIENSASAEDTAELLGGSPDTTYDLGPLIELPAAIAPAEVTLRALIIGK